MTTRHALSMTWSELAFLHWKVDPEELQRHLPDDLQIDAFEGSAYLGVVPFLMEDVRLRWMPRVPKAHTFAELNLRTYVTHRGHRGVWFFSLDAASKLSVRGARATFSLPYFDAKMEHEPPAEEGGWTSYRSERTHRGAPPAVFRGRYRPTGPPSPGAPGSLEHFLTERYTLFAKADFGVPRFPRGAALRGALLRGDIKHTPWPLQPAEAELSECDVFRLIGRDGPPAGEPLVHFASSVTVKAGAPFRAR